MTCSPFARTGIGQVCLWEKGCDGLLAPLPTFSVTQSLLFLTLELQKGEEDQIKGRGKYLLDHPASWLLRASQIDILPGFPTNLGSRAISDNKSPHLWPIVWLIPSDSEFLVLRLLRCSQSKSPCPLAEVLSGTSLGSHVEGPWAGVPSRECPPGPRH